MVVVPLFLLDTNFCGTRDVLVFIQGINNESDRRWYGSVLLNRLMFVYFLQDKYFLNKGTANIYKIS
jgi:hypothetical protein